MDASNVVRLREAMNYRRFRTSLSAMAVESGLSRSTVSAFLGGSQPTAATYRKLLRWYTAYVVPENVSND